MRETIVVTGGAGYIGSHIGYLLAQKGYHVILLDKLIYHQSTAPFSWATVQVNDYGDAAVLDALFKEHRVKAVVHCAAYIEVGRSVKEPNDFYENNVVKTITLLDRMRAHNVPYMIFSSSCAVYGTPQIVPIPEDHPQNPISPYGNTKHMIELMLKDYDHAYGIKYVALRYFNAAGALAEQHLCEQHDPETHLIPLLIRSALTGKPFSIFGTNHPTPDGTCIRDYVHVIDIADAHIRALNHLMKGNPSDSFNLGTGMGISVREMINAVERLYDLKLKIVNADPRAGDPPILVAQAARAQDILQWEPRNSTLDLMIKSAYASLVKHVK
jgi:UDP-glucose 4-epimerase